MSTNKQEARGATRTELHSPWPHVRLAETDRLETFSDSVLSITITLLVAEIVRPELAPGQLLDKLTAQWASYIAFLASFCYASVIWLNHRAVFARVRYCDRSLHLANLFLLLTSALIPFPTAILSTAIQSGNEFDAKVAVTLYAAIAGTMLSWLVVFRVLSIHPYLVEDGVSPDFFPKERFRAWLGVHPVCHRRPRRLAVDAEARFARLPGIAGFLRHNQRGFDGNTNSPAVWQGPSRSYREERSFGEKRSRGGAHRMTFGGGAIFTVSGSCMQFVQPPASLATSSDRPASHRPISRHQ